MYVYYAKMMANYVHDVLLNYVITQKSANYKSRQGGRSKQNNRKKRKK